MNSTHWKHTGFGATLVAAPIAYNLVMSYWFSVCLGFLDIPSGSSMATIVSYMGAANLVGIAAVAVAFVYLVSLAYPQSLVAMTFVVGVAIVLFNVAAHLLFFSRDLPNPITLTEWASVLVVFPLVAMLLRTVVAKRHG